jgi:hypothetical protein
VDPPIAAVLFAIAAVAVLALLGLGLVSLILG